MVQRDDIDYSAIAMTLQSTKKTNVVLQSAPGELYNDPLITVNGQILIYLTMHLPGKQFRQISAH